ncbi:packaged DNA stabilization protein [Hyphomonas sp. CY54-11-8]|uniref:packaged DNA stabilization protein n=1 Tax=Hyphomonas sp. CY54-11-8 TaxID=1280944 RepID=UPI00045911CF|nr:packaged DNA stabilization protein [Hyphomonas sp. CY54-11-8]KCZ47776.1 hypothetical protein HY17_04685 [Hyphomonas sp. CY54-11-8]
MSAAVISSSHYEADSYGDARKWCINYYAEKNPTDPQRPMRLVTTPGSVIVDNGSVLGGIPRGLFQADGFASGKLVVPDGTTIRLYDPNVDAWTSLSGPITGSDRVKAAFGEVEAAFLANGALFVSDGSSVAAVTDADFATLLSDHSQTAFSSVVTIGQRMVFTYGSRFGYSAALDFDNTTTLNYYTAENAPDGIVAAAVLGDMLWIFGTQTIEPWVQTGDNDDPFRPLTAQVVRRGCMARDTIRVLDNSLFFIADDRTVRRLDGLVPTILNADDAWVTRHLEGVSASDVICSTMETDAHSFYIINTPTACIVYDVATGQWHKRESYDEDTWEWAYIVRKDATFYAGSRLYSTLVTLSRSYRSDRMADSSTFGTEIVRKFSAHLPVMKGVPPIHCVRLDTLSGVGLNSGQGSSPVISLEVSADRGNTFYDMGDASLGEIGAYDAQVYWDGCGRIEPQMGVLLFSMSDPVASAPAMVAINER